MDNSFQNFAHKFSDALPAFAWHSWTALGLFGTSPRNVATSRWVVDPEPLLLFTLEVARHDPRLFDELTDWLLAHEKSINTQRLAALLGKQTGLGDPVVLGAVAAWIAKEKPRAQRWRLLAERLRRPGRTAPTSLFHAGHRPMPSAGKNDTEFASYGLLRPPKLRRDLGAQRLPDSPEALVFRLRALMGIDARADVLAFLLTHDGGHARELARRLAYSPMRTHEVLVDLAASGKVLEADKGRTRVFWVARAAWWDFLFDRNTDPLPMPDWVRLLHGLTILWRAVWNVAPDSDQYFISSALRSAWREARNDLMNCEAGLQLPDDRSWPAESFLPVFADHVLRLIEALGTGRPSNKRRAPRPPNGT